MEVAFPPQRIRAKESWQQQQQFGPAAFGPQRLGKITFNKVPERDPELAWSSLVTIHPRMAGSIKGASQPHGCPGKLVADRQPNGGESEGSGDRSGTAPLVGSPPTRFPVASCSGLQPAGLNSGFPVEAEPLGLERVQGRLRSGSCQGFDAIAIQRIQARQSPQKVTPNLPEPDLSRSWIIGGDACAPSNGPCLIGHHSAAGQPVPAPGQESPQQPRRPLIVAPSFESM